MPVSMVSFASCVLPTLNQLSGLLELFRLESEGSGPKPEGDALKTDP